MNPYPNLPPSQRRTQRLVEQFNADERLWQSLAGKRKLRRKLHPKMAPKRRQKLDLLDFARLRRPQDCIGERANS
jgi:hypothetical protein